MTFIIISLQQPGGRCSLDNRSGDVASQHRNREPEQSHQHTTPIRLKRCTVYKLLLARVTQKDAIPGA